MGATAETATLSVPLVVMGNGWSVRLWLCSTVCGAGAAGKVGG